MMSMNCFTQYKPNLTDCTHPLNHNRKYTTVYISPETRSHNFCELLQKSTLTRKTFSLAHNLVLTPVEILQSLTEKKKTFNTK